jgi:hypothetical protein
MQRESASGIASRRGFVRAFAAFALLLIASLSAAPQASAATAINASFAEAGGYGRIVLGWPGAVPAHQEALNSGVLVVKFDKPFSTDLDEFVRQMPGYVAIAKQDADGKTLRLALKFDYWLNVRQAENSLYIDLLPTSWTGAPPPLPADVLARIAAAREAKQKAEEEAKLIKQRGIVEPGAPKPGLSVRVATHDGITRLVFDWNQPVLYSLVQQEGSATITFDRTASVALAPIRVDPPPYLQTITAQEHDGRLSIFMKLAPGVTVSDFREELGVVVDLKPTQPVRPDMADASAPQTRLPPEPAAAPAPQPQVEAHAPQAILPATAALAPKDVAPKETPKAAEAAPATPTREEERKPQAEAKPAPTPQQAEAPPPAPAPAMEAKAAPAEPAPVAQTAEAGNADALVPLEVIAREQADRTDVSFPWSGPTGAAVFVRADTLWVVFDQKAPLDLSRVGPNLTKRLGPPVNVPIDGGTALAFPILGRDLLVGAEEDGTGWRVSVGEALASTGRPLSVARSWSDSGLGVVSFDLHGARKVIEIKDPIVKDTLYVATARAPIQAMQSPRSFIEFQALQTAQGVAIVRVADDLNVAAASDAVVVTRRSGLTLSADKDGPAYSDSTGGSPAFVDFTAWRGKGSYTDERKAHQKQVALSDVQGLAGARLSFARFYIANQLGPEALTQLDLALAADPKLGSDPTYHALRGIAGVLAHRYPSAIADLSISALAMDSNAAAWRGLAHAGAGQPDSARRDFDLAAPVLDSMDPAIATRIQVKAAGVDLAMKDVAGAQAHVRHLPAKIADRRLRAEADLVEAQIIESLNRPDEAADAYDRVIALGERPFDVRARFAKAIMLNRNHKLSDAKLATELDKLRMMWRGDDLERQILSKLAELRLQQGDIVAALHIMHTATMNFPDSDDARAMGARMPDIFADFFIDGQANQLPAVQALAFYQDFQNLTPLGKKGDELIRHLAERLVSVDLLLQAENLLSYQIDQRLVGGVAKAQVAARLAAVYLLDGKASDALRTIRSTMQNLLPQDLDEQRRLIEARALASLKQYDLSLDLLSEILGPSSDALRADVLWEAQRWDEAGQAAETLLAGATADKTLSADDRFQIMRGAIAYSLADDQAGLNRLRTRFGARMAQTDDASGFAIVSDPIERQGVAFRDLASRIASVNTVQRFINSLKKDDKVSSLDGAAVASSQ